MSDALVIGSGPNGLAAAITLAQAGLPVTVLEAAEEPGGAVRTEPLTLPGFLHDTCSAVHPSALASPVFSRMPLAEHGLEWVHPRACMAHPLPDGRAAVLYRDLEETVACLDGLCRGDGARWARLVAPYLNAFEAVRATALAGFPPVAGALRLMSSAGPRAVGGLARVLFEPAQALAGRLFEGEGARAWLYGTCLHGDVALADRGSAFASFHLSLLGHAVGWPSPRGGAQRLTDALVSYLHSLGGRVRTGARIERILVRAGRVTGLGVHGGEELRAQLVLADVMPQALLAMCGGLPGGALASFYRRMLARYAYGPATFKVDWALSGPIPWSSPQAGEAGTVHVGGHAGELPASLAHTSPLSPAGPFLVLGQQSIADAARAPEGRHTAWAYTRGPAGFGWEGRRQSLVAAIEQRVERFAPGFGERILARHVMTPAQLQARNANLVNGDVGGGSYVPRQAIFRPLPSLNPYRTPVEGLFLCSAATFPGGSVHGVPGAAAARAALRSLHGAAADGGGADGEPGLMASAG